MQHINVLKQEVKHAKKIIGDPKARDKLISDLNFSRVVTTKQEQNPQTEAERNFNPNIIKIYPQAGNRKIMRKTRQQQHSSLNVESGLLTAALNGNQRPLSQ